MLVMYLCVRGINVDHVFVYYGNRSFYCNCVLGVSMLPHVFVCEGYRCWFCICVLGALIFVIYLYVMGIDVGHAIVY